VKREPKKPYTVKSGRLPGMAGGPKRAPSDSLSGKIAEISAIKRFSSFDKTGVLGIAVFLF
jgi:hypothetical protein